MDILIHSKDGFHLKASQEGSMNPKLVVQEVTTNWRLLEGEKHQKELAELIQLYSSYFLGTYYFQNDIILSDETLGTNSRWSSGKVYMELTCPNGLLEIR